MADEIDIELFIEEIKQYPEIWNVCHENYNDRAKKRAAWNNICSLFSEEFDEKDDREKNEICNKLIKKWRNIKDSFLKSLKRKLRYGQAADTGRKYIYARQLSFLRTTGYTSETQFNLQDYDEVEDEEQLEEQPATPEEPIQTIHPEGLNLTKYDGRKRKRDVESELVNFLNTHIPSSADPDRSFFESILPSIRDFDEDTKIEFRCGILNLVKRLRANQKIQGANIPSHAY